MPQPIYTPTSLSKPLDKIVNVTARQGFYRVANTAGLATLLTAISAAGDPAPSSTDPVYADQADTGTLWRHDGSGWAAIVSVAAWTVYTPTLTGFTLGNGTVSARYSKSARAVNASGLITFGSTTSVSGTIAVSLPSTVTGTFNSVTAALGVGWAADASAGTSTIMFPTISSSTTALFRGATGLGASAASPFTWATGDTLSWNISYESV